MESKDVKKILVIFGTRPEAIKMCPLVKELYKRKSLKTIVCVTGQHRELLDQVLGVFDISPEYDLSIMKENQSLYEITHEVLEEVKKILISEIPDVVLVHGDTTTAFASALAAFYMKIPVGHVEAGLRTYDMYSPYPEEFNRQAIDIISELMFAPTETAKNNLIKEGKNEKRIFVTGNTAIDALETTVCSCYSHPELQWVDGRKLILMTAHRRENIGENMRGMFRAIKRVVDERNDVCVIYPVHLNPEVRAVADEIFKNDEKIHLIEPLDVFDFHNFMNASFLIMTDSGGIQEEAPHLGKPVLVMRNTTERPEGIEAGTLKLVGTNEDYIYKCAIELITDQKKYEAMSMSSNPYGDGHACERIADILDESFYAECSL